MAILAKTRCGGVMVVSGEWVGVGVTYSPINQKECEMHPRAMAYGRGLAKTNLHMITRLALCMQYHTAPEFGSPL